MNALEKAARGAAKYAYAFNQGKARVVLDPIYSAVAARLVPDATPLHPKLLAMEFPPNLFLDYRAHNRKLSYFIEDWDFTQADPTLLTPRQRQMMHTVALGETSGAAVADGFLRAFRTNPELASFFGTWFTEELNHFMGFHLYLGRMEQTWPARRGYEVASTEFEPYSKDPLEMCACNMYQELVAFLVYRSFAKQAKDPFLAKMVGQFAKDELRHYKFYQQVIARHLQKEPGFRKRVLMQVLKATTPYNQVSGSKRNVLDHLELGAFYFRKSEFEFFTRELEVLMGKSMVPVFDAFFRGVNDPCTFCRQELHQCDCAHFEDGQPPQTRNPEWWQQVSKASAGAPNVDVAGWSKQLTRDRAELN